MRLIVTFEEADFDILSSMLSARLLHPGAEPVLPQKVREDARIFHAENKELLPFTDPEDLEEGSFLEELILLGQLEEGSREEFEYYRKKARRISAYSLPRGDGREAGTGPLTSHMVMALKQKQVSLSPGEADFLALGILRKASSLEESGTAADFEALAYLLQQGGNLARIAAYLPGTPRLPLFFEKVAANSTLKTIGGYRVLFCTGELGDYLEGVVYLIHMLLKAVQAQMALVIFPFESNNYINAVALEDAALDLEALFAPFHPGGGPLHLSFFQQGSPDVILKQLENHLYQNLQAGLRARDIMDRYIKSIPPEAAIQEARGQLERRGGTTLPVVNSEGFLGTVSLLQIDKALRLGYGGSAVETIMDTEGPRAAPETPLNLLLKQMAAGPRDLIPVLDSRGHLAGAVTAGDLLQALYREKNPLLSRPTDLTASLGGNVEKLVQEKTPKYLKGILYMLGKAASDLGYPAFAVGGFVRDLILGLESGDLDVVVEGSVSALAKKVKDVLGGKLKENPEFGTARLALARLNIDFATARQEFYAHAGALPEVERSSLKKDLFRRDFTVNTLAFQLNPESFGRFFNYYGGLEDLENRKLRVLYNLSFVEDPLRILRAVRLKLRLGFELDPGTRELMIKALKNRVLYKVTRERLTAELELAFRERKVMLTVRELEELGVLAQVFPQVQPGPENFRILRNLEELILQQDPEQREKIHPMPLFIAGLFYGTPSRDLFGRLNRVRLTRRGLELVAEALEEEEKTGELLAKPGLPVEEIYGIFSRMAPETCLYLLATAKNSQAREYYESFTRDLEHLAPAVTGKELLKMGLEPGPIFKDILDRLKAEKLRGTIKGIEDEIHYIQKHYLPEKGIDL